MNTDCYLKVFERFDDTGRTTTTWSWAACLCTLNWKLFRQLWGAALVYVAAAEGLALIVFGVGRSFLHWPVGIELGVLGAFAVLAFAVPRLYGNAILYADIRKRIARAGCIAHRARSLRAARKAGQLAQAAAGARAGKRSAGPGRTDRLPTWRCLRRT